MKNNLVTNDDDTDVTFCDVMEPLLFINIRMPYIPSKVPAAL